MDLRHSEQVVLTARGRCTDGTGLGTHLKRWFGAASIAYQPSALPVRQVVEVPIVMAALPHEDITDATLYSLRQAVARSLDTRPSARRACVTVISTGHTSTASDETSETSVHRRHLMRLRLRQWAQPLDLSGRQSSCHVLESGDVAEALVNFAVGNRVNVLVLGAATHGLKLQCLLATVPI